MPLKQRTKPVLKLPAWSILRYLWMKSWGSEKQNEEILICIRQLTWAGTDLRISLRYPHSVTLRVGRSLWSLSPAASLALRSAFGRFLAVPPLPLVSICVSDITHWQDSHTGDFHPISSRPCRAYTKISSGPGGPWVLQYW